jgi:RimJ/RimL family protein N-acetyltransferase
VLHRNPYPNPVISPIRSQVQLPQTFAGDRLQLRRWRKEDLPAFAALNADSRVTEFLLNRLSQSESDTLAERIEQHFAHHGYGLWAVEVFGVADFIGFTGLRIPPPEFKTHFTPCVEIAWRLAYDYWGFGYATEAARLALGYGFKEVGLQQIVAFTVPANQRSRKVMERLGMTRLPQDDFDHPLVPEGHRLRRHVLYRIDRNGSES